MSNDNFFIIRKPILTSKEELLNVTEFGSAQPPTSDTDCDDVFDADTDCDDDFDTDYDIDADWAEPKSGVREQKKEP